MIELLRGRVSPFYSTESEMLILGDTFSILKKIKPESVDMIFGEFIKMALIAGSKENVGPSKSDHWASSYYDDAIQKSYFTASDIAKDQLDKWISREHVALILSAIIEGGDESIEKNISDKIPDVDNAHPYQKAIVECYATGVLTGYTDGSFRPSKTLTREEAVVIVHRLLDEKRRIIPDPEKMEQTEKFPVADVLKNYDRFYSNGILVDVIAEYAKTCSFDNNPEKYQLSLKENRGTTWIQADAHQDAFQYTFYVKDNEIFAFKQFGTEIGGSWKSVYHGDEIFQVDYFGSLDTETGNILLIKNPFRK